MTARVVSFPGRPRDPSIDAAVRRAVLDLLGEVGYARTTVDEVARRANVGRPAVYRRWQSKAHLVLDVLFEVDMAPQIRRSGDVRADLVELIQGVVRSFRRPPARSALPGLLTDLGDPRERAGILGHLERSLGEQLLEILGAPTTSVGVAVDPQLLVDVLVGTVFNRVIARGGSVRGFAGQLADVIIAAAGPGAPAASPDRSAR